MKHIKYQIGFTFTEVIAVVAISAVIAGISSPLIQSLHGQVSAESVHAEFSRSLSAAREASVSLGKSVSLCPSISGSACDSQDWSQGWITYVGAASEKSGFEVLDSKRVAENAELVARVTDELFVEQDRIEFSYRGFNAQDKSLLVTFCSDPANNSFSSLMVERSGRQIQLGLSAHGDSDNLFLKNLQENNSAVVRCEV